MAMILIYCHRSHSDKVRDSFQAILDRIRERINSEKKFLHYLGKISMVMETGGSIEDLLREKYID
jgi:hypothetical protein